MNTQNLLHDRSAEIPEGLYLDLMNKLKLDFDTKNPEPKIVIITKNLPSRIKCSKADMIQNIIKASVHWEDRDEILLQITKNRVFIKDIEHICTSRGIALMKENPRWARQQNLMEQLGTARLVEAVRNARVHTIL